MVQEHESVKTTYNLDLLFLTPSKRDRWFPPVAEVALKNWGMRGDPPHDTWTISHECMSPSEFDDEIDRLVAELEKIRKEGHRRFARYRSALKVPARFLRLACGIGERLVGGRSGIVSS
jgi:hypothetical protein